MKEKKNMYVKFQLRACMTYIVQKPKGYINRVGERGEGIQRLSSLGILCIHWRRGGFPCSITQSRPEMQHTLNMLLFLLYKKWRKLQGEANEKFTFCFGLWAEKMHLILSPYFPWLEKGKYYFSLSVKEFLISYFVTQPSVAIANSSEIWSDSWKTWRIPADSWKLERGQEGEETDGCGMEA